MSKDILLIYDTLPILFLPPTSDPLSVSVSAEYSGGGRNRFHPYLTPKLWASYPVPRDSHYQIPIPNFDKYPTLCLLWVHGRLAD
ncbi:hypothetical protein C8J56DRAFT_1170177 [Mycena floridula]|nr:hypothetical protein C8J56DRAFT_1170177 [Mycena floridula]